MNRTDFDRRIHIDLDRFSQFSQLTFLRKYLTPALIVLALLIVAFMTVYQIQPEEVGVVTRLGRFVRTSEPGLNFKMPLLEGVQKVPVQRQLKQEFGFRTEEAGVKTRYSPNAFPEESIMLTGDLNVAVVEWIVQYRVSDPYRYLFKVRNVEETFRSMNEAVMREVVGDRTVTEVLTVGRQDIETAVQEKLQHLAKAVRHRNYGRPGRPAGCESARPGQALLGCRQPGTTTARPAD